MSERWELEKPGTVVVALLSTRSFEQLGETKFQFEIAVSVRYRGSETSGAITHLVGQRHYSHKKSCMDRGRYMLLMFGFSEAKEDSHAH